jgi:hypothetical protein
LLGEVRLCRTFDWLDFVVGKGSHLFDAISRQSLALNQLNQSKANALFQYSISPRPFASKAAYTAPVSNRQLRFCQARNCKCAVATNQPVRQETRHDTRDIATHNCMRYTKALTPLTCLFLRVLTRCYVYAVAIAVGKGQDSEVGIAFGNLLEPLVASTAGRKWIQVLGTTGGLF